MVKDKKAAQPKKTAKNEKTTTADNNPAPNTQASVMASTVVESPDKAQVVASVSPTTLLTSQPDPNDEIILTDAEGRRYCRVSDCDQIANVDTYCRYHYLLHWKKIQVRKKILADGKLERYIEELTSRY